MYRTLPFHHLAQMLLLMVLACFGLVAHAQSCGGRGQAPCADGCNENFAPNARGNRCVPCGSRGNPCPVVSPECTAADTSACTGGDTCTDVICNAAGECDTTPTTCNEPPTCFTTEAATCALEGGCSYPTEVACAGANQMFDASAADCCVCAEGFENTSMDGGLDCTVTCGPASGEAILFDGSDPNCFAIGLGNFPNDDDCEVACVANGLPLCSRDSIVGACTGYIEIAESGCRTGEPEPFPGGLGLSWESCFSESMDG